MWLWKDLFALYGYYFRSDVFFFLKKNELLIYITLHLIFVTVMIISTNITVWLGMMLVKLSAYPSVTQSLDKIEEISKFRIVFKTRKVGGEKK